MRKLYGDCSDFIALVANASASVMLTRLLAAGTKRPSADVVLSND